MGTMAARVSILVAKRPRFAYGKHFRAVGVFVSQPMERQGFAQPARGRFRQREKGAIMSSPTPTPPSAQDLKQALKAFRKRLKLTQLDAESTLNGGHLSGRAGKIQAIMPPNQYPQAVWAELTRQGKIKPAGHGTYQLVEER
jgi:hypothetical protein